MITENFSFTNNKVTPGKLMKKKENVKHEKHDPLETHRVLVFYKGVENLRQNRTLCKVQQILHSIVVTRGVGDGVIDGSKRS